MSSKRGSTRASIIFALVLLACSTEDGTSAGFDGGAGAAGMAGQGNTPEMMQDGGAANPFAECEGVEIVTDGVLDLDMTAVSVSGSVTLNGGALPDETRGRGTVTFADGSGIGTLSVDLGTVGARTYAVRLPTGTYDITYEPSKGACESLPAPTIPCSERVLVSGAPIMVDGVLDVDIPAASISVTGAVTLNGTLMPEQVSGRGALVFRGEQGSVTAPLVATGAATYATTLTPGTYDVEYAGDPEACSSATAPPAIPCMTGEILSDLPLMASGVLDVDVPAVTVSGRVTLNGAPLADENLARGSILFTRADGASATSSPLGASGPGEYAVTIFPGEYATALEANASLCAPGTSPLVPCVGGPLGGSFDLGASGVLDLDIPAVTISGSVTLAGAPLPNELGDRGSLSVVGKEGASGSASLGATGPGSYRLRVVAGTYDIAYAANADLCNNAAALPSVPCNGSVLTRDLPLMTDGVYDADLRRVAVSGNVTVEGAAMPNAAGERGKLAFTSTGGSSVSTPPIVPTGAASYALSLWPGTYDIAYVGNAGLCAPGAALPPVPCLGGGLRGDVPLQNDGVLDLDLALITVSGTITLNGQTLLSQSSDRGSVQVVSLSAASPSLEFPLGTDLLPIYSFTAIPGFFAFGHIANAAACVDGAPLPIVPCASQGLIGCQ